MRSTRRRLLVVILVVALVALAGCEGRPTEPEVCYGCGDRLGQAATAVVGSEVTVENSSAHLSVGPDGDARMVARANLSGPGVARLRADPEAVDRSVRVARGEAEPPEPDAEDLEREPRTERTTDTRTPTPRRYTTGTYGYPEIVPALEATDLDGRMRGSTLVIEFRVREFARSHSTGTVLSDTFYRFDGDDDLPGSTDSSVRVATDSFVVSGPNGTRVLVHPDAAAVDGGQVALSAREIPPDWYLVFTPPGLAGTVFGRFVLSSDVLGWALPRALYGALIPAGLLGPLALLFVTRYEGPDAPDEPLVGNPIVQFFAAAGGLVIVLLVGLLTGPGAIVALVLYAGVLGFLWHRHRGSADPESTTEANPTTGTAAEADAPADAAPVSESASGVTPVSLAPASADPDPDGWLSTLWLRPLTVTAFVAMALTLLLTAIPGTWLAMVVAVPVGFVPVAAMAKLGEASTTEGRTERQWWLVAATAATPWVVSLAVAIHQAEAWIPGLLAVLGWGFVAAVLGGVLFYGTRRQATAET